MKIWIGKVIINKTLLAGITELEKNLWFAKENGASKNLFSDGITLKTYSETFRSMADEI